MVQLSVRDGMSPNFSSLTSEALLDVNTYGMVILRNLSSSTARKHLRRGQRGVRGYFRFRLGCIRN